MVFVYFPLQLFDAVFGMNHFPGVFRNVSHREAVLFFVYIFQLCLEGVQMVIPFFQGFFFFLFALDFAYEALPVYFLEVRE